MTIKFGGEAVAKRRDAFEREVQAAANESCSPGSSGDQKVHQAVYVSSLRTVNGCRPAQVSILVRTVVIASLYDLRYAPEADIQAAIISLHTLSHWAVQLSQDHAR